MKILLSGVLAFLALVSWPGAQEAEKECGITPTVVGSLRIPAGKGTSGWETFPTAGVSVALPVTLHPFSCYMSIETGKLAHRDVSVDVQTFHVDFGLKMEVFQFGRYFDIAPVVGLSSMMVGIGGGDIDVSSLHLFGKVENEYGFFAGLIPTFRRGRFEASLPLYGERIFSYPNRFSMVVCALRLGYRIAR